MDEKKADRIFEFKFRKFAAYESEDQDIYNALKHSTDSFMRGEEFTKIFILAMALGYAKGQPKPLKNPFRNNIPTHVFSVDEKWMMISLYMSTKNKKLDSLYDADEILSNAEEYANEGLKHLWFIYKNSKNPVEDLESEFRMYLE